VNWGAGVYRRMCSTAGELLAQDVLRGVRVCVGGGGGRGKCVRSRGGAGVCGCEVGSRCVHMRTCSTAGALLAEDGLHVWGWVGVWRVCEASVCVINACGSAVVFAA
jgi:hypothetical protein